MRASPWTAAFVAASLSLLLCVAARAQTSSAGEPAAQEKAGKEFHALRLSATTPPIRIDGRMDDEVWARAEAISDFVQEDPDNMAPPTERMTIRVAYDDRYLYVAVEMFMREASDIRDGLGRRGSAPPSDRIQIGFDTAHDHTNAYLFEVNASGVQNDFTVVNDTQSNNDYEAVWEVATLRSMQGWNAEFRIPFSQMRFPVAPGDKTVWGFNVRREIFSRGESDWWIAKPRGTQGLVSRYGHLVFGDRLTPPRRLEITPYTLGSLQTKSDAPAAGAANGGVDLRVGLGTSANVSATINPDFGQVEADPSVLNLSVFETFFPEKRAFFLEDSQAIAISSFQQFPDFYSRRIGQTPGHFALADNETLVRKPDQTTILGAAKLTGGTAHSTFGGLTALTSREYADVDATDATGGASIVRRVRKLIEPRTLYSVGRAQRTILSDSSSVGLIATSTVREKDLDSTTVGGDANIRRDRNRVNLNSHWVETRAPISGVIRYGLGGSNNANYTAKYFNVNAHYDHFAATFRNTDLGFLSSRTSKNEADIGMNLYQPNPRGLLRNSQFNVYSGRQWNKDWLVFGRWAGANYNINFTNFWNVNVGVNRNFVHFDDLDTRGGPPIRRPVDTSFNLNVNSDSRKRWGVSFHGSTVRDRTRGWATVFGPAVRLQPTQRLLGSMSAEYTTARDAAQWIKNIDADGDGVDDNVYGTLRRNVVNITGRATYSFTRDMTLEAYLQPFVAVGNYTDVRKLARPKSFDFTPVSLVDNPDFNQKSVRGTVVLRWEYLRGSTLFAVWNLATSDTASRLGMFSPLRDLSGAFTAPGTNTFAIKLSYWFTP